MLVAREITVHDSEQITGKAEVSQKLSASLVGHHGQAVPRRFPGNADSVCSTAGDQEVRDRCVRGTSASTLRNKSKGKGALRKLRASLWHDSTCRSGASKVRGVNQITP